MRFRFLAHILCATVLSTGVEAATKLNGPLVAGGQVRAFKIAPSGTHVVYEADQEIDEHRELFSRPLNTQTAPRKISGVLGHTGVDWDFGQFRISNDSERVVFRAFASPDSNRIDLFSVPLDGTAPPINLNGPMFGPFGSHPADGDFQVSPDSNRVIFSAESGNGMFSALIDGSSARVAIDLARYGIGPMLISPDGTQLIFWHPIEPSMEPYNSGVFTQPLDGSAPARRLDDASGNVISRSFLITPDGSRIVFTVSKGDPRWSVHYSAALDGGSPPIPLNDQLLQNGINPPFSPPAYQLSSDGNYLFFYFDIGADGKIESFVRPIDGSAEAKRFNGSPPYRSLQFVPNSRRVVYHAPQDQTGATELVTHSLIGDDPAIKLNGPIPEGFKLNGFEITPDGSRVVYSIYDALRPGNFRYFSSPIDASSPAVPLYDAPEGPARLWGRKFSPDGSYIVFGVDLDGFLIDYGQDLPEIHVLYAVSTTGGTPWPITEILDGGRYIRDFQIAPDSRSVIYLANQDDKEVVELFSVPVIVPEPITAAMLLIMIVIVLIDTRTRKHVIGHEPRNSSQPVKADRY